MIRLRTTRPEWRREIKKRMVIEGIKEGITTKGQDIKGTVRPRREIIIRRGVSPTEIRLQTTEESNRRRETAVLPRYVKTVGRTIMVNAVRGRQHASLAGKVGTSSRIAQI